jgi:hypothetical protein
MMRVSLNQHPEVACHGELFGAGKAWGFANGFYDPAHRFSNTDDATAFRDSDIQGFLRRAFGEGLQPTLKAVGFKALYEQLLRPEAAAALELIARDDTIDVIHNWRIDLHARFLSDHIYRTRHRNKHKTETVSIELSVEQMLSDFDNQIAMRDRVNRIFGQHRRLDIFYEHVVSAGHMKEVPEFLGLSQPVPVTPRHIDFAPKIEVVVVNADELRMAARQDTAPPGVKASLG